MWRLIHGRVEDILPTFPDNHFDAVITDPPYNLSFMGKEWDTIKDFQEWVKNWAAELLRVMKPGTYLLAFGSPRTYHRLACGVEDAGFVIKDCLMWVYGSGFPKSLDISKQFDKMAGAEREIIGYSDSGLHRGKIADFSPQNPNDYKPPITAPATPLAKQWQGWGTALKPAYEPIVLAQKPVEKNYCHNIKKWGCGGLNIDGCRIETNWEKEYPESWFRSGKSKENTQDYWGEGNIKKKYGCRQNI